MKRLALPATAVVVFVALALAANIVTAAYGPVDWDLGWVTISVTAGTYAAGLVLLARDWVQDTAGIWWVSACIAAGALASWVMTDSPRLAIASATAFALSEVLDLAVYSKLKAKGWAKAAAASNVAGSVLDSLVFLWIAGFLSWGILGGQVLVKILVTFMVIGAVEAVRREA